MSIVLPRPGAEDVRGAVCERSVYVCEKGGHSEREVCKGDRKGQASLQPHFSRFSCASFQLFMKYLAISLTPGAVIPIGL